MKLLATISLSGPWRACRGLILLLAAVLRAEPMVWPTPHPAPTAGGDFTEWVQATESGDPVSGMFGCVRTHGTQFHEALDIGPFLPRKNGEPTDPVGAAWAGTVVYVNTVPRTSAYGRYVVVQHDQFSPAFVTLYAHLASVEAGLAPGRRLAAGERIGIMGRSAGGYRIPPERSHLHFEIALRLSDDFQRWYDSLDFDSANDHGIWNGMNLIGLDPWLAWQFMRADPATRTLPDYLRTQPIAFVVEVVTSEVPDFVARYPALLSAPADNVAGWRIAVTGWGMPIECTPLARGAIEGRPGAARVVAVDPAQLEAWSCRGLVTYENGEARLALRGRRLLQLLFTFELQD